MSKTAPASTSFKLPSWVPFVVFALTTVIFFRAHIFSGSFFWDDFNEQVYPNRAYAAKHISQGEIPYWNPNSFCGMPFMADVQTALFYPPHLLLDLIAGNGQYPIKLLQLLIILHFFIAQISMYLLCRRLKISMYGAMIAAVSYGFSSPLVLHVFHPMQVEHLAWFPLILRFLHESVTEKKLMSVVITGILLGMTMLSGSPQMTLYMGLFLGIAVLWLGLGSVISKQQTLQHATLSMVYGLIALAIGGGLFFIQYLPSKELASLSERNEMTFEKATVGSLEFKQIITAAVPKAFGDVKPETQNNKTQFYLNEREYYLYWDTAFYFGIVTFLLGMFGAIRKWNTKEGSLFIAMALFGFLFALGSNGFLYSIFYNLPFFGTLRIPARMMFYVSFCFSILAGYGFDELVTSSSKDNKVLYGLGGAAILPIFFALGVSTGSIVEAPEQMASAISSYGSTALIVAILGFVLSILVYKKLLNGMIGSLAILLLVFIDLHYNSAGFNVGKMNPVKDYEDTFRPDLRVLLQAKDVADPYRISMRARGIMALKRNQGLIDNVHLFEGYNQLLLAKRHPQANNEATVRDLLGIRYEIGIDSVRGASFVQRPNRFRNAWMVYKAIETSEDKVKAVMKDSLDYNNIVVVEGSANVASLSGKNSADVPHSVTCTQYESNKLAYKVQTNEPGILCLSEIWYPAWNAYVDGKYVDVHRANYCLRAINIPAGEHTVEFRYESSSFTSGAMVTLGTLGVCVVMLIGMQIQMMRKNKGAS